MNLLGTPSTPVVVTGAGSGIGRATALALAEVGRPVAAWDLNGDTAAKTAAECAALGVATHSHAVDVADLEAIRAAHAATLDTLGGIGGLVNGAGIPFGGTPDAYGTEEFDNVLAVNLRSYAVITGELLPSLRDARPGAAIVCIASVEGLIGHGHVPAYCASKAGVIGLVRSLAGRLGHEQIRVNAVAPGFIATPMLFGADQDPEARKGIEHLVPLGRLGQPEDIARTIRYLLSDEASYVNGTTLVADGGQTAIGGQVYTPM